MARNQYLKSVSKETLSVFEAISSKAKEKVSGYSQFTSESFAYPNALDIEKAVSNVNSISENNRRGYEALIREPAICRVIVSDDGGDKKTYYISRRSQIALNGRASLASYNSAIGRLASIPVGDEEKINISGELKYVEVIEKIRYQSIYSNNQWDSIDNTFDSIDMGVLSIESLRALLTERKENIDPELLDSLLAENDGLGISEGIKHQARMSMELRDQPILDQFQDSIFRLPIDSQLLILGPPGTGKTTTLIKRLGQKLDVESLDRTDKSIVDSLNSNLLHEVNWLMFTPTELLKHYIKEAFNREQVPASDQHIKTWDAHRLALSRNVLGVLQSPTSNGKFIYKKSVNFLQDGVLKDPTKWFDAFLDFHQTRALKKLTDGDELLEKYKTIDNSELIELVHAVMNAAKKTDLMVVYRKLESLESKIKPYLKSLKKDSDESIKKGLSFAVNTNNLFLDELGEFIDSLSEADEAEYEEDDELDDDLEDDSEPLQTTKQKAAKAYNQAIRSLARAKYLKRSIPKNSKAAIIKEWLGDRLPNDEVLLKTGRNIAVQTGLRRFMNASKRYVSDASASYREFRKSSFKQDVWYTSLPDNVKHISSMELDAIVLLYLKTSRTLLHQRFIKQNINESRNALIKMISDQFKNQILVDEATDFSPIQLACMENLTNLTTQSFYACGDFNQRITSWGTQTIEQMEWVSGAFQVEKINTVYRQSKKLNEFSGSLLEVMGGSLESLGKLPDYSSHTGFSPALLENASDIDCIVEWLSNRIQEVEKSVKQMPTTAVLVNSEAEVKPMAEALTELLEDINLRAVACVEGQSLGDGNDVRVFDIQHIKGLEFEAVFFIGVDDLSQLMPELFDKYLYVGSTRAATYLGMTCSAQIPDKLNKTKELFVDDWSSI